MAVDSFSHSSSSVLDDLDPLSRALLDLSVQRGMDDGEIAGILGTDKESVFEVRVGLLRNLADKVAPEHADDEIPELQALIAERVYAEAEPTNGNGNGAAVHVDEVPEIDNEGDEVTRPNLRAVPDWVQEAPAPRPETPKRRSPLTYLVPVLGLVAIVAAVIAITGGGDADSTAPTQQPAATDTPAGDGKATRLEAIGAGKARGTATLNGDRLTLNVSGLANPDGGSYQIWLYDSIIDAEAIGASKGKTIELDARLPANAQDFKYVDVSLEPADGNPNHSGQSVLRVPMAELR